MRRRSSFFPRAVLLAPVALAAGCGPADDPRDEAWIVQSGWPVHEACAQHGTTTFGIDVSKWQSSIDWPAVQGDGVVYAFVRVSDGTQYVDEQFEANWQGTKAAGILRGPYQYFRPGQDAIEQAQLFVDKIEQAGGFEVGDLPPVIDVETTDGMPTPQAVQAVEEWIAHVEANTGRRTIIYTGSYFWDDNSFGSSLSSYPLWTAHYTSAACPLVSDGWDHWTFWQYTSTGTVAGISGNVDENVFDGSLAQLEQFIQDSVIAGPADAGADAPVDTGMPEAGSDGAAGGPGIDASVEAGTDAGSTDAGDAGADGPASDPPGGGIYEAEEADGCACRTGMRRPLRPAWWVAAGLALLLGVRRRRRVKRCATGVAA